VAVRTDDIALSELREKTISRHRSCSLKKPEFLPFGIAVVEVHYVWRELSAAVGAGHAPKFA
jgi:hypothetical protein